MERRGLFVIVSTFLLLGVAAGLQFSGQYDIIQVMQSEDIQTTLVIGLAVVLILVLWILAMIFLAKILYRLWKKIDSQLFRFLDLVIPESPIIRFGIILTVFIFLFAFGPLVVIQLVGMDSGSEDIENQVGLNESNSSAEDPAVDNETAATVEASYSGPIRNQYFEVDLSLLSVPDPAG